MSLRLFPLFISFFLIKTALASEVTLLHPPKGWECIQDQTQLPQKVRLIYIGMATQTALNPSINIACETTPLSLDEYIRVAKTYHEGQGNTRCTLLGKVQTQSGMAQLMQIDRPSQWGDVRFAQAILIHNDEAFVTTATCLKKDFSQLAPVFYKAFQSLVIKE